MLLKLKCISILGIPPRAKIALGSGLGIRASVGILFPLINTHLLPMLNEEVTTRTDLLHVPLDVAVRGLSLCSLGLKKLAKRGWSEGRTLILILGHLNAAVDTPTSNIAQMGPRGVGLVVGVVSFSPRFAA